MGELREADGTEHGALFAGGVETDDLDLLFLVLLVHAKQLRFQ